MASRKDIEAGRAHVLLYVNQSALVAGLKKAGQQLRTFGTQMAGIGSRMAMAGGLMSVPLAMAVKNFADFDDAMLAVKGVSQATTDEWKLLTKTAKDLGASTSFTAVQVASLMVELGRAGFKPDEINDMTGAVLNLARATGTDATLSSGIMAAAIRQFSLGATAATRVADVLTAGANKTFNTVEALGEALSYAGPVAADFGMSIEETVAILGTLGNVGIQGSNAGTALRRMMIITGAEAQKLKGIFGVNFLDAAGNARPLVDVFEEINAATASLGTGTRAQKFNEAFGLLGITGASVVGRNVGSMRELQAALNAAGGTAAKTAAEMDSGLGGALRILLSAVEGVKISFGNALSPVLMKIGNILTLANGVVREFIDNNQGIAVVIAGAVAALTVGGLAVSAFGFAMIGVGAAISTVATVIGAVLSPIGLLIGGVAAATAAFVTLTDTGRWLAETLLGDFTIAFETVKDVFRSVTDALKAGELRLAGELAMTGLKLAFFEGTKAIRTAWVEFNRGLVEDMHFAATTILSDWRDVSQTLAKMFAELGYEIALMVSGEQNFLTDAERIGARDSALNSYYDTLQGNLQGTIDDLGSGIEDSLNAQLAEGEQRIERLRAQLGRLKTEARMGVSAAPGGTAPTGTAISVPNIAPAGMGIGKSGSAVTFSAAAAAALGQGSGPLNKLVGIADRHRQTSEKLLRAQQEQNRRMDFIMGLFRTT